MLFLSHWAAGRDWWDHLRRDRRVGDRLLSHSAVCCQKCFSLFFQFGDAYVRDLSIMGYLSMPNCKIKMLPLFFFKTKMCTRIYLWNVIQFTFFQQQAEAHTEIENSIDFGVNMFQFYDHLICWLAPRNIISFASISP